MYQQSIHLHMLYNQLLKEPHYKRKINIFPWMSYTDNNNSISWHFVGYNLCKSLNHRKFSIKAYLTAHYISYMLSLM